MADQTDPNIVGGDSVAGETDPQPYAAPVPGNDSQINAVGEDQMMQHHDAEMLAAAQEVEHPGTVNDVKRMKNQ